MLFDDIYNDIVNSFGQLWKTKQRGETLEIITPFVTTSDRFVSLFLSKINNNYIVSDGAWISEGLYDVILNLEQDCLTRIFSHYINSYEIKETKNSHGSKVFYKKNENTLAVPAMILDMANFVSAIASCSEILFAKEELDKNYMRFRREADDYLHSFIPKDKLNTSVSLLQNDKSIRVNATITVEEVKLILVNYVTGSNSGHFANSIFRTNFVFEVISGSYLKDNIISRISLIDNTAPGYSSNIDNRLSLMLQHTDSKRVDWSAKSDLIVLISPN